MIKLLLKLTFAIAIIYWLVVKGHLDFSLIPESLNHYWNWVAAISLMLINVVATSYRWKFLLEIKAKCKLPPVRLLGLTWIGMFFSTVLPGAVTGDLIKLVYAKDLDKKLTKSFLITSALLDRIIGMFGLLIILGIFSIISYNDLTAMSEKIRPILHLNFMIFGGMLGFFLTMFIPHHWQFFILTQVGKIPVAGEKIKHLLEQFWLIGRSKKTVILCTVMSTATQLGSMFAFWLLTMPFYTVDVPLQYAITFVPLGLITVAIPISPSGLGVGHAMFAFLYSLVGISSGASLFNLFFIAMVMINLIGVIPYLFFGKKKGLDQEMEQFESA